jgi:hypothetical protein
LRQHIYRRIDVQQEIAAAKVPSSLRSGVPLQLNFSRSENITTNSTPKKAVFVTAKRVKNEGGKRYRYRPTQAHIHRLTICH